MFLLGLGHHGAIGGCIGHGRLPCEVAFKFAVGFESGRSVAARGRYRRFISAASVLRSRRPFLEFASRSSCPMLMKVHMTLDTMFIGPCMLQVTFVALPCDARSYSTMLLAVIGLVMSRLSVIFDGVALCDGELAGAAFAVAFPFQRRARTRRRTAKGLLHRLALLERRPFHAAVKVGPDACRPFLAVR